MPNPASVGSLDRLSIRLTKSLNDQSRDDAKAGRVRRPQHRCTSTSTRQRPPEWPWDCAQEVDDSLLLLSAQLIESVDDLSLAARGGSCRTLATTRSFSNSLIRLPRTTAGPDMCQVKFRAALLVVSILMAIYFWGRRDGVVRATRTESAKCEVHR